MTWRRQLPAYSPLPLGAVMAGAAGLASGVGAARAGVKAALARAIRGDEVLLTDGGTGALALAIRAASGEAPGASVALPAYGCYDLATAADGAGVPVLLYDLDTETLAPDPASLRAALALGARAVVLAHWYGIPADPEAVRAATHDAGALLIEDAAQAAGATWHGTPLGSFGDLTVCSFGRGKGTTAGRGGALLSRGAAGNAAFARARGDVRRAVRGLPELVRLKAQWLLGRPALYAVPSALPFLRLGETVYHPPAPVRAMSAVATRTLARTLPLADRETQVRRANAARLTASVARGLTPVRVPVGGVGGFLRLPLLAGARARARAAAPSARALGVMPGYPLALCDLPGFTERVLNRTEAFPGARDLAERLVTAPTHGMLSDADLARLERWLAERET